MVKTTGGLQDAKAFSAIFCNATGMFGYYSAMPGNCFYQQATCDRASFLELVNFVSGPTAATLGLMVNGIAPQAVPVPGSGDTTTWVDRTRVCSDQYNLDANVTLAADNTPLGWSQGATAIDPLNRSCTVSNAGAAITRFAAREHRGRPGRSLCREARRCGGALLLFEHPSQPIDAYH